MLHCMSLKLGDTSFESKKKKNCKNIFYLSWCRTFGRLVSLLNVYLNIYTHQCRFLSCGMTTVKRSGAHLLYLFSGHPLHFVTGGVGEAWKLTSTPQHTCIQLHKMGLIHLNYGGLIKDAAKQMPLTRQTAETSAEHFCRAPDGDGESHVQTPFCFKLKRESQSGILNSGSFFLFSC